MTGAAIIESTADGGHRNRAIDGFRAVAVSGVVFGHATAYRYADLPLHPISRFAGPASETGVQLFFVISGFIITSLLLREQARTGTVSIGAFYARRLCRIMPPLAAYVAALVALSLTGWIAATPRDVLPGLTFTCNTGLVHCDWWVAHSWSLAVEEQYYLGWPLLFVLLPAAWRVRFLLATLLTLSVLFVVRPPEWHGNPASFACIAIGALYALSPAVRATVARLTHPAAWLGACAVLMLAPFTPAARLAGLLAPALTLYVLFAGCAIPWVRALLESRPLQVIGLASYSLYLWQQLFLAAPHLYPAGALPLLALPVAVAGSVLLVERPSIRLGHRLSRMIANRRRAPVLAEGRA